MKRQNIEVVLGFLDSIRRGDREAADGFLDPEIFWQGVVPDLACHNPGEVLGIFLRRRDDPGIEVERIELIGAERGAVFAFHRPGVWEIGDMEIRGVMYHSAEIEGGRIMRIADYADRAQALAAVGLKDG